MPAQSTIRYSTFPRTQRPPRFVELVASVFRKHEQAISTSDLAKGLTSDEVLAIVAQDLLALDFGVETGKKKAQKIYRPVRFGENGVPDLQYQIDAFHDGWKCGLEVEAGRASMGNAIYRDLFQAAVLVDLEYFFLAVPNTYKFRSGDKETASRDYENAVAISESIYGHEHRFRMPYGLAVLGY